MRLTVGHGWIILRNGLGDCLLHNGVSLQRGQGAAQYFPRIAGALAALSGNTGLLPQAAEIRHSGLGGVADGGIGNPFAQADVHCALTSIR